MPNRSSVGYVGDSASKTPPSQCSWSVESNLNICSNFLNLAICI